MQPENNASTVYCFQTVSINRQDKHDSDLTGVDGSRISIRRVLHCIYSYKEMLLVLFIIFPVPL